MAEMHPDFHSYLQALGSTLDAFDADSDMAHYAGLEAAGSDLARAAGDDDETNWDPELGYYSPRDLAEQLFDALRAYPGDVAAEVCACIAEGRTSDLWKVLP